MVRMTEELVEAGRSRNGGWSAAQLRLFGIEGFPKGWKRNVLRMDVPQHTVDEFLALKDKHLGL